MCHWPRPTSLHARRSKLILFQCRSLIRASDKEKILNASMARIAVFLNPPLTQYKSDCPCTAYGLQRRWPFYDPLDRRWSVKPRVQQRRPWRPSASSSGVGNSSKAISWPQKVKQWDRDLQKGCHARCWHQSHMYLHYCRLLFWCAQNNCFLDNVRRWNTVLATLLIYRKTLHMYVYMYIAEL